jgi:phosphohistidine phosphatase SixA
MRLYLLRHATAEDHGIRPDAERALVDKGWKQTRRVAAFCRAHDISPSLVLTSPLVRARETAKGFCQGLGLPEPVIVPWLGLGRAAREAPEELMAYRDHESVCLVGHEPDFSMLAANLLGTGHHALRVTKASLLALDFTSPAPGRATLVFFVPNKLMGE